MSDILYDNIVTGGDKICGFYFYIDSLKAEEKYNVFKHFEERFSGDDVLKKLGVLEGKGDPISVLGSVLSGIDLFESPYPFEMAKENGALVFEHGMPEEYKTEFEDTKSIFSEIDSEAKWIDLSSEEFKDDEGKLSPNCTCHSC